MTAQDFEFVRQLLKERCALMLEPGKEYLVETRLMPIVRQLQLQSISELVERLRAKDGNGQLETRIVEAMITSETSFFRDHHPFESLRKTVLPDLLRRRRSQRRLSVWCAACATGQEPYSLAMLIREHFPELTGWHLTLLASDLSREVLARAAEGVYNPIEVTRGLPPTLLAKYFEPQGTSWQLRADIRSMVKFQEFNLARPWPRLPHMDLVLLRNVLIYFDAPTKKAILGRVAHLLRPDGYLLLGSAETTLTQVDFFQRCKHLRGGFFQLVDAGAKEKG
jgi:chemotaxis protein methyltransferase CheR